MGRYFNRGASIPFTHTFYDSTGGITSPSSAYLTVTYPSSGWPYRGVMETTRVAMTQQSSTYSSPLAWTATWDSLASDAWPGPVFWDVRSNDLSLAVETSQFELRGNPANMTITTTT